MTSVNIQWNGDDGVCFCTKPTRLIELRSASSLMDTSFLSEALSRFRAKQSLLFLLNGACLAAVHTWRVGTIICTASRSKVELIRSFVPTHYVITCTNMNNAISMANVLIVHLPWTHLNNSAVFFIWFVKFPFTCSSLFALQREHICTKLAYDANFQDITKDI
jgi:hypothetical protein